MGGHQIFPVPCFTLVLNQKTPADQCVLSRDFLAAPANVKTDKRDGKSWLVEHGELIELVQRIRSTLSARSTAPSHSTYGMTREAKGELVELVRRSEALTKELDALAKQGMTEGELDRRRKMLLKIQDEATSLSAQVSNHSSVATDQNISTGESAFVRPTSVTRALGGPPQETHATRTLDNAGLMQLQQQVMDDQDSQVDELLKSIRRQREMATLISEELTSQDELLDTIDKGVDRVQGGIKRANKDMKKL